MKIRQVRREDIPQIVEIFMTSFPDSVSHIFGKAKPNPRGMQDLIEFIYECEPEAIFVAQDGEGGGEDDGDKEKFGSSDAGRGERITGYIISPRSMRRLWCLALIKGYIFKWFIRWLRGDYGLGLMPVRLILQNKLSFILTPYHYIHSADAQILSIAVVKEMRGKGVGSELLKRAMQYLRDLGVHQIKLEVRPENIPARAMYKKFGFIEEGTSHDSQGEWVIMICRQLQERNEGTGGTYTDDEGETSRSS